MFLFEFVIVILIWEMDRGCSIPASLHSDLHAPPSPTSLPFSCFLPFYSHYLSKMQKRNPFNASSLPTTTCPPHEFQSLHQSMEFNETLRDIFLTQCGEIPIFIFKWILGVFISFSNWFSEFSYHEIDVGWELGISICSQYF